MNSLIVYKGKDITIEWNGSATFNVWHRGINTDAFTNYNAKTPSQAVRVAREWVIENVWN